LDAGAPYNRKFFQGGLWFDAEEEAENIPVGFDSEEGFTEWIKIEMWQIEFGLR
jgi:hypothetical protein